MARKATGTVTPELLTDGTLAFRLRFRAYGERERDTLHERRDCTCGCGGGWTEKTAQIELENILAKVQARIWKPGERIAVTPAAAPRRTQTFHEYASYWLAAKRSGTLGAPIAPATYDRLLSQLTQHLLPFFAKYRLDEIDRDLCLAFKERKLTEADELRQALAGGAKLRHRNGRKVRPLAASSIRKLIDVLAQILDDAVEDGHVDRNPARAKRMRVAVPRPPRTFLEQDELALLLDAAAASDRASEPPRPAVPAGATAAQVAVLAAEGLRAIDIAKRLGKGKATITYHLRRLDAHTIEPYTGRQAVAATLGYAGPRVSELCDLRIGQLRLHDADGARFHIPDAKTPTGVRAVEISPALAELLVDHLDRLRRAGLPTGPTAWAFPNTRGGRLTRQRAGELVRDAATAATTEAERRGMPPLPNVTPHSLRRTYVSIALLASNFDIKWVMSQVGHADSSMTLDVYAQLQQRAQRDHGKRFDAFINGARDRMPAVPEASIGTPNGPRTPSEVPDHVPTEWSATA